MADDREQKAEEGRYAFLTMMSGFKQVTQALATTTEQIGVLVQQQAALISQNQEIIQQNQSLILHIRSLQEQIGVQVKLQGARSGFDVRGIPLPLVDLNGGVGRMPQGGGVTPLY